jgi:hypothetical protein
LIGAAGCNCGAGAGLLTAAMVVSAFEELMRSLRTRRSPDFERELERALFVDLRARDSRSRERVLDDLTKAAGAGRAAATVLP